MTESAKPSPLSILATALAFMIRADNDVGVEERAGFLTVFQKHVRRHDLSEPQLRKLTDDAFARAARGNAEAFLRDAAAALTHGQKTAIVLNLFDVMQADGRMTQGETHLLESALDAFGVDRESFRAIRAVLTLKNDTTIFTNPLHPGNEAGYALAVKLAR